MSSEDQVHLLGTVVGDHHLLEHPPQHLAQTIRRTGRFEAARTLQLRQQMGGPFYGAGYQ